MHYVTINGGGLGIVINHDLIDLQAASISLGLALPCADMWALIDAGSEAQSGVENLAHLAHQGRIACSDYDPQKVTSALPYLRRNVFCIGKNYADHAAEIADKMGISADLPKYPIVFSKATNTLIGPLDTIPLHEGVTRKIDYEGELALVIGKAGVNYWVTRVTTTCRQGTFKNAMANGTWGNVLMASGLWAPPLRPHTAKH